MLYPITPVAAKYPPYAYMENVFSNEELDTLQNRARAAADAGLVGSNEVNLDIRRSNVSWLKAAPDTFWIFDRLAATCASLNEQFYRFDITGFGEDLQLSNYRHDNHGTYGWHCDFNGAVSRKLSVVVQLTDPSEYEGGNLEIMTEANPTVVRKARGLLVIFPAFNLHRVTPVTRGDRQSLVAWVSGAPFR